MKKLLLVLLLVGCGLGSHALAGDIYFGASLGRATLEASNQGFRFDVDDTGYKAFVGYRFLKFLAVEGAYTDLGTFEDSVSGAAIDAEADVASVFAVGVVPVGRRINVFAKAGISRWDSSILVTPDFGTQNASDDDGFDTSLGLGLTVKITERIAIRGEWETYDFDNAEDVKFGSVGIHFDF